MLDNNRMKKNQNSEPENEARIVVDIKPKKGWKVPNVKELLEYKDLFIFLIWRDIKVMYAQTILGFSWAILLPVVQIIIFTIIFGKVAKIDTDGVPYVLFSTVAIIPWTFISQAMSQSSMSLVSNAGILGKVYFPRIIFPLTPIFAKIVDFSISLVILLVVIIYYRVPFTWEIIFLPIFILMMISVSAGFGIVLSALAIRFRDVKHAMQFCMRMLMYTAPVVYSASNIPDKYRFVYSLNPLVGTIEGFRACLLGSPIPWKYIFPGLFTLFILSAFSIFYFKKLEEYFVDVI